VSRYLHRIQLKQATAPEWAFGVGAFIKGNILLVGEQASDPKNAPEQQPFCSSKGCSGWLNRLLEEDGVPEDKLYWLNALNNDGSVVNFRSYLAALEPSTVIALGNVAARVCSEQDIPFVKCYHPQYWKRFHSMKPYPLLDLLQQSLKNIPVGRDGLESFLQADINRHADRRVTAVS
jgi:hypothetical protein